MDESSASGSLSNLIYSLECPWFRRMKEWLLYPKNRQRGLRLRLPQVMDDTYAAIDAFAFIVHLYSQ